MNRGVIFVGYDSRAPQAYAAAERSAMVMSAYRARVRPLDAADLRRQNLLWRPTTTDADGNLFDVLSNAPQSTEFAITRFLVPFIHPQGWCLFVDQDVIFLADPAELFDLVDSRFAVMVVKHQMPDTGDTKMMGQKQTSYPRKNWSSVCLVNASHPAHFRLSVGMVNQYPGDLLHRFFWLRDSEIGELPPEWNWLVGVQPKPFSPKLAHFTLGGPWIPGWKGAQYDEIWTDIAASS